MSLLKEFKEFAVKGNVLELAVAVVIGAAFGKIVSALVESIIMPIIALIFGGHTDFAKDWAFMGIKYGVFIQSVIDFLIVAAALFLFIKVFNKLTRAQPKEEQVEANTALLTEIRDLLRQK